MLSVSAIDCNSILNLKRSLRANSASVRFYRNASVKLTLGNKYRGALGLIKGQHMFLIFEQNCDTLAICKLIAKFIEAKGAQVRVFVWNHTLFEPKCVELIASLNNEDTLKAYLLFTLKLVLLRAVSVVSSPLKSFISLLTQSGADV
ncbi:MAG: hypothetical protein AAJB65_00555 [Candidatus Hodgkinia cicadicola]